MNTCANCRFYARNAMPANHTGECRRRAPYNHEHVRTFPTTFPADWCGEHELKDQPPKPAVAYPPGQYVVVADGLTYIMRNVTACVPCG